MIPKNNEIINNYYCRSKILYIINCNIFNQKTIIYTNNSDVIIKNYNEKLTIVGNRIKDKISEELIKIYKNIYFIGYNKNELPKWYKKILLVL